MTNEDVEKKVDELKKNIFNYLKNHKDISITPLFHYTSYAGLTGILQIRQLWQTDHAFLNDPSASWQEC